MLKNTLALEEKKRAQRKDSEISEDPYHKFGKSESGTSDPMREKVLATHLKFISS